MIINANTKIGAIIKEKPEALEQIISLRPVFEKLRNPLLRKIIATRTSIAMASRLGGCSISDFYGKLQPLGFEIDTVTLPEAEEKEPAPDFILSLKDGQLVDLDVRPVISSGKDPLKLIMEQVKTLKGGQVLKLINSFEPTPLIALLDKKGYLSYVDNRGDGLVETYFYKSEKALEPEKPEINTAQSDWDEMMERYRGNLHTIDVRELAMPLPMHTILESLDELETGKALYVYHKRIPVFLLPELQDRQFDYRIKEIKEGEVHLLIFRK